MSDSNSNKKLAQLYLAYGIIFLLIIWILYAIENYFGISLSSRGRIKPGEKPMELWLPIAGTVLTLLITPYLYWQKKRFLANAIEISGVVTAHGISINSFQDLKYTYEFNGQTFTGKQSLSVAEMSSYPIGGKVDLQIDPHHPEKSSIKEF